MCVCVCVCVYTLQGLTLYLYMRTNEVSKHLWINIGSHIYLNQSK